MNRTIRQLVIVAVAILAALPFLIRPWRTAVDSNVLSCLHSVHSALQSEKIRNTKLSISPTMQSQILGQTDYEKVKILLSTKDNSFDCGRVSTSTNGYVDTWGGKIEIIIRQSEGGEREFAVWSKGRDGVTKTRDDLVYPQRFKHMLP